MASPGADEGHGRGSAITARRRAAPRPSSGQRPPPPPRRFAYNYLSPTPPPTRSAHLHALRCTAPPRTPPPPGAPQARAGNGQLFSNVTANLWNDLGLALYNQAGVWPIPMVQYIYMYRSLELYTYSGPLLRAFAEWVAVAVVGVVGVALGWAGLGSTPAMRVRRALVCVCVSDGEQHSSGRSPSSK